MPARRILSAPTTASGKFETKIATSKVALPLSIRPIPIARFGDAVEGDPRQQGEPDRGPRSVAPFRVALEPGGSNDEDGRAGKEGRSGPPGAPVLEGLFEELERDRR